MIRDDASRAIRRALYHVAWADSIHLRPWSDICVRACRLHRRRLAAGVVVVGTLLTGAGAANALVASRGDDSGPRFEVAPTTTDGTTTTTAPKSGTDSTVPSDVPPASTQEPTTDSTTTTTTAKPGDIDGTLTLASPTLVAGERVGYTLTVRNDTGADFSVAPQFMYLGVHVGNDFGGTCAQADDVYFALAAGEQRTYTSEFVPPPESIGAATIYAMYLDDVSSGNCLSQGAPRGVEPLQVTVVPPGWAAGDTLEPSQGIWSADLSSDGPVHVGEAIALRERVHNDSAQPQRTRGYGSLTIWCWGVGTEDQYWQRGWLVDDTTLGPGQVRTFSVEFQPDATVRGYASCSLYMTFGSDPDDAHYSRRIHTSGTYVEVVDAPEPTSTSAAVAP